MVSLVFADVDGSSFGAEAELRTTLADGSPGDCVTPAVVDVQIEIALDVAVVAFGIHLEGGVAGYIDNDLAPVIINIHSSQRGLQMKLHGSIAIFDLDIAIELLYFHVLGRSPQAKWPH